MTTVFIKYRERFSSGVELRTAVQAEVANPKNPQRGTSNKTTQLDNSATTNHLRKDTSNNTYHMLPNLPPLLFVHSISSVGYVSSLAEDSFVTTGGWR